LFARPINILLNPIKILLNPFHDVFVAARILARQRAQVLDGVVDVPKFIVPRPVIGRSRPINFWSALRFWRQSPAAVRAGRIAAYFKQSQVKLI
jgi:hypothetical protein